MLPSPYIQFIIQQKKRYQKVIKGLYAREQ